jgi:galactose mutarotase-like enzyme
VIRPPSGEQFEIHHGDQRAVVVEVGAALREYQAGERPLLDGFALEEAADGSRGQALIPWPNRIRDGRYEWEGEAQQLDLTEVARGNAIHGLVRWHNWSLMDRSADRVALGLRLHPMPGYPFLLDLEIAYRLSDAGLEVRTRAENIGPRPCPYGVGFHPYLTVGEVLDDTALRVPAGRRLISDERGIPTSSEAVAGGRHDFRNARAIGDLRLDDCFCDLARDGDGRARVTIEQDGRRVTLWLGEAYEYVMLYSGDTLAPRRRRRSIAVEPMTCPPNAFVSGDGLVRLEPGGVNVAMWGIEP